jgi:hypothetical protein
MITNKDTPLPPQAKPGYLKTLESLRFVESLLKNLESQDNLSTAKPILICVQELKQSAVVDEGYHSAGVTGYDREEVRWCYSHDDSVFEAFTREEVLSQIKEYFEDDFDEDKDYEDEMILVQYKYVDVAWFLSHVEADKFIERDKHNLKKPRKYVKSLSYKNEEMYHVIEALKALPKMLEELNWATHMLFACGTGMTQMLASGIRHQYQFPNYMNPATAEDSAEGQPNG